MNKQIARTFKSVLHAPISKNAKLLYVWLQTMVACEPQEGNKFSIRLPEPVELPRFLTASAATELAKSGFINGLKCLWDKNGDLLIELNA